MKNRFGIRRQSGGFSMIEVLIALVVLAFGLLGLALLQTMNLRYTKSANQRTQAVNLANELLDSIRANRSMVAAYAMTEANFASVTVGANGCSTPTTLGASAVVARWQCEVRETLGADAYAEVSVNTGTDVVEVTVVWSESNMPAITDAGKVTLETVL